MCEKQSLSPERNCGSEGRAGCPITEGLPPSSLLLSEGPSATLPSVCRRAAVATHVAHYHQGGQVGCLVIDQNIRPLVTS